jgi:alkanesulfonate monooxygenase SsuD/methylene tetrahydromethanopterin reductase-like flavin-dependent oxidoreductase (luciferase family)
VADVTLFPKPAHKPHPPLWVGGHTDRAIRRTAELGDAWHPIGLRDTVGLLPDELAARVEQLRAATTRAGRDPRSVRVAFRAPLDLWGPRERRPAPADRPLAGPPAKVIDDIRAYQRAGVGTFVFDFARQEPRAMLATMTRFARDVRPRVTRLPATRGAR